MKVVFSFVIVALIDGIFSSDNPEVNMNDVDIISHYGYPIQLHQTTTEDGYILTLHRIPFGKNSPEGPTKPVVFLQHGLLDSSFTWVSNPPNQSLAYILADLGYDVWMGNNRGNTYSREHKTLSPKSNTFWQFSWDEMAQFDLPTMINYVLNFVKMPKLSYIGHSQGSEIAFAKLSENSSLNSQLSSVVALAPVAFIGHAKSAVAYLSGLSGLINVGAQLFNHGEFFPSHEVATKLTDLVCGNNEMVEICSNILFLIAGYDVENLNNSRIPIYLAHIPAGTSSKNMMHYAQSYVSNKFQKYDYGFFGNPSKYGSFFAPQYRLSTHGVPVGVFYGGNDWMATPEDVNRTIKELGDSVDYVSYLPSYNHLDFVWGINAANEVYKDVAAFIRRHQ